MRIIKLSTVSGHTYALSGLKYDSTVNTECEKILFCKNGFSENKKGGGPAYAIKFEDSDVTRVIPESNVDYYEVDNGDVPTAAVTEADVPMPE